MAQTVGDFLLQRLSQWGVKRIYGYPGDGINGIMGALGRNKEMEFVQARHEELIVPREVRAIDWIARTIDLG